MAYILALAVAIGSFAMYMTAFFFPEVHRKNDFIWSGVGLFYALVLWVCAGRITGGVLLGQIGSVVLLGYFAWETLNLRWENAVKTTDVDPNKLKQKLGFLQPVINGFNWVKGLVLKPKSVPEQKTPPVPTVKPPSTPVVEEKKEETSVTSKVEVEEKKEETTSPVIEEKKEETSVTSKVEVEEKKEETTPPVVEEKKEETTPPVVEEKKEETTPPVVEEKKEETPATSKVEQKEEISSTPKVDQVTAQNIVDPFATTPQNEPTNTVPVTTEETTKTNPEQPFTT